MTNVPNPLLAAALTFNFHRLKLGLATEPAAAFAPPGAPTVVHGMCNAFNHFKAGEVSRMIPWPNASTVLYTYEMNSLLARASLPLLRGFLERAPRLARAADAHGITPLHLASRLCLDDFVRELLRAGASPLALTARERRSPIDDAAQSGCVEALQLLLAGLPTPEARRTALAAVGEYASLPGAALSPRALAPLYRSLLPPPQPPPPRARRPRLEGARADGRPADAPTCAEGGGWDVEAPPSEEERRQCDLDQVSGLSPSEYAASFYGRSRPLLVRGALSLAQRCSMAKETPVMRTIGTRKTSCGRTAYPTLTGQRPCGQFSIVDLDRHPSCSDKERTLPVCALKPSSRCSSQPCINASGGVFSYMPAQLRYEEKVPVDPMLTAAWATSSSHQLFAGGRGSGAALHFHNAAYNVQFFGVKRWLLTPPRHTGISGSASTAWRDTAMRRQLPAGLPLRCTQGPGDMLILPASWGHATVNDAFALGVGNLYCDVRMANYTGDATCRAMYAHHTRYSQQDKATRLKATIERSLGIEGTSPLRGRRGGGWEGWPLRNGMHDWSAAYAAPYDGAASRSLRDELGALKSSRAQPSKAHALAPAKAHAPAPAPRARVAAAATKSMAAAARPTAAAATSTAAAVVAPKVSAAKPGCRSGEASFRHVAFVHINKAGGTAMLAVLLQRARHQMLQATTPRAASQLHSLGSRFFHASASLQKRVLTAARGSTAWDDAYTFALVRNPFARQVSMFHFLLQEASCKRPVGQRPEHCEKRLLPPAGPWLSDRKECATRFRTWLAQLRRAFPPGSADAHFFGSRSHGNEIDPWFNASQVSWLVDGAGVRLVKDVIKLEELEARWPSLQAAICGLKGTPYTADGLRRNPSSHAHYSEYYDEPTRRIVEEYMGADLKAFGYTFERA